MTSTPITMGPAADHAETAAALRRRARRSALQLGAGAAAVAAALAARAAGMDDGVGELLGGIVVVAGVLAMLTGAAGAYAWLSLRAVLTRAPWVQHPVRYRYWAGRGAVVVVSPGSPESRALRAVTLPGRRQRLLAEADGRSLWAATTEGKAAAVAPVGAGEIVCARLARPGSREERELLRILEG